VAVATACWWSPPYNLPGFWLLKAAPGRMAVSQPFGSGGGVGGAPATLPSPPSSVGLRGVPGEGLASVPLPPPAGVPNCSQHVPKRL
jgi:hypothetical protein